MNDFFARLAARALGRAEFARPRLAARFAPGPELAEPEGGSEPKTQLRREASSTRRRGLEEEPLGALSEQDPLDAELEVSQPPAREVRGTRKTPRPSAGKPAREPSEEAVSKPLELPSSVDPAGDRRSASAARRQTCSPAPSIAGGRAADSGASEGVESAESPEAESADTLPVGIEPPPQAVRGGGPRPAAPVQRAADAAVGAARGSRVEPEPAVSDPSVEEIMTSDEGSDTSRREPSEASAEIGEAGKDELPEDVVAPAKSRVEPMPQLSESGVDPILSTGVQPVQRRSDSSLAAESVADDSSVAGESSGTDRGATEGSPPADVAASKESCAVAGESSGTDRGVAEESLPAKVVAPTESGAEQPLRRRSEAGVESEELGDGRAPAPGVQPAQRHSAPSVAGESTGTYPGAVAGESSGTVVGESSGTDRGAAADQLCEEVVAPRESGAERSLQRRSEAGVESEELGDDRAPAPGVQPVQRHSDPSGTVESSGAAVGSSGTAASESSGTSDVESSVESSDTERRGTEGGLPEEADVAPGESVSGAVPLRPEASTGGEGPGGEDRLEPGSGTGTAAAAGKEASASTPGEPAASSVQRATATISSDAAPRFETPRHASGTRPFEGESTVARPALEDRARLAERALEAAGGPPGDPDTRLPDPTHPRVESRRASDLAVGSESGPHPTEDGVAREKSPGRSGTGTDENRRSAGPTEPHGTSGSPLQVTGEPSSASTMRSSETPAVPESSNVGSVEGSVVPVQRRIATTPQVPPTGSRASVPAEADRSESAAESSQAFQSTASGAVPSDKVTQSSGKEELAEGIPERVAGPSTDAPVQRKIAESGPASGSGLEGELGAQETAADPVGAPPQAHHPVQRRAADRQRKPGNDPSNWRPPLDPTLPTPNGDLAAARRHDREAGPAAKPSDARVGGTPPDSEIERALERPREPRLEMTAPSTLPRQADRAPALDPTSQDPWSGVESRPDAGPRSGLEPRAAGAMDRSRSESRDRARAIRLPSPPPMDAIQRKVATPGSTGVGSAGGPLGGLVATRSAAQSPAGARPSTSAIVSAAGDSGTSTSSTGHGAPRAAAAPSGGGQDLGSSETGIGAARPSFGVEAPSASQLRRPDAAKPALGSEPIGSIDPPMPATTAERPAEPSFADAETVARVEQMEPVERVEPSEPDEPTMPAIAETPVARTSQRRGPSRSRGAALRTRLGPSLPELEVEIGRIEVRPPPPARPPSPSGTKLRLTLAEYLGRRRGGRV